MSQEAVIEFIEAVEANPSLRQQLNSAESPEIAIAIAEEQGYQFTQAELLAVMQEKQLSFASEVELSEEQLEAVAGGKQSVETKEGSYTTYNGKLKA